MILIKDTIDVDIPVRSAYDQWARFEGLPNLMDTVREVRRMDDGRLHWRAEIGGRTVEWDSEIIDQIPDQLISIKGADGGRHAGLVRFEPLGDSVTRIILQIEFDADTDPDRVGEAFRATAKQIHGELENFKRCAERDACVPGAGGVHGNS